VQLFILQFKVCVCFQKLVIFLIYIITKIYLYKVLLYNNLYMSYSLTKIKKNNYRYNRSSSVEYDLLCKKISSRYNNKVCSLFGCLSIILSYI